MTQERYEPWRKTLLPEAEAIQTFFGYPHDAPIWAENPAVRRLCEAQAERTWAMAQKPDAEPRSPERVS